MPHCELCLRLKFGCKAAGHGETVCADAEATCNCYAAAACAP